MPFPVCPWPACPLCSQFTSSYPHSCAPPASAVLWALQSDTGLWCLGKLLPPGINPGTKGQNSDLVHRTTPGWAPAPGNFLTDPRVSHLPRVFPGTPSLIRMVASGPKEGRISGSLPLTCTITGAPLDSPRYDWNSVRQAPRGELQFLGWIYPFGNNTGYAPPFQGRVTISADKDTNKVSLQLRNLTASDTATYFCARQHTVMLTEGEAAQKGGGLLR